MNVIKVKPLMAILLAFTVGAVGCTTDLPVSTSSLQGTGISIDADQNAETTANKTIAQTSYHQPVNTSPSASSSELAPAPLTTLGLDDDIFEMVEQANGVVLLDFYADWCGPCRTQGGILHEMEDTASQNDASIIKVNVDQHRQLASALNVTALPTLVLIKDGKIVKRQTGLADHQRVANLLSM